jgi:pimeloyl-ACP methyl ester carboxylesterase
MSDFRLHASDGVALDAREWAPVGTPRATVVLIHGFSAGKDDPQVGAVADALTADGMAVVAVDCRGHGGSEGECTLGDLERHDVEAAVDHAAISGTPIVLVGASMGAIAALRYAATSSSNRVAGVVTVSSPAEWKLPRTARGFLAAGVTRTGLGRHLAARFLRVRVHREWTNPAPPRALVASLRVPLAIIHGSADRFVPAAAADALFAAGGNDYALRQLTIVPGMGHAFDDHAVPAILAAVSWTLSATTTPALTHQGRYATPSPR